MRVRVASTFSLLFLTGAVFGAEDYSRLDARLRSASDAEVIAVVRQDPLALTDPELRTYLQSGRAKVAAIRQVVSVRARFEGGRPSSDVEPAAKTVDRIKREGLFVDHSAENANWAGEAVNRIRNLFNLPDLRRSNVPIGAPNLLGVVSFVQAVLVLAAIALTVFALRYVQLKFALRRKAKAMLADDEPIRTRDEWLAEADALIAAGRYRDAARALYLATLLRLDEARVARFIRHETNWEHLRRIEASPLRPADLDFREPTKSFDRIWYGNDVRGIGDAELFRNYYAQVVERLERGSA